MVSRMQQGFTLVELAIVLVIIGLIVGGVLVGQDLIKSAEIRATVTQIEKFNAAATTFRDKFGGLPGDLSERRAVQFGLTPTGRGGAGEGDANNVIQASGVDAAGNGASYLKGETLMFWGDLTQAAFISNTVQAATVTTPGSYNTGAVTDLPATRMRETAVFHVYSSGGHNFIYVGTPEVAADGAVAITSGGISPFQAFSIDQKLDNGNGEEGVVIAVQSIDPTNDPTTDADCMDGNGVYATTDATANLIACDIVIRASF